MKQMVTIVFTVIYFMAGHVFAQQLPTATSTIFMGSGKCAACHAPGPPNTSALLDREGRDVSPPNLWRSTMMANAAKEIFWQAKVTAEVQAHPALQSVIEDKCTTCHAPMGRTEAIYNGASAYSFSEMKEDTLAMDGVSCTVCHQIKADNLGRSESYSGHYHIENDRIIYGPFQNPITNPMQVNVNYTPQFGSQTLNSELCATCHTLFTPYVDNDGNVVGTAPEQTPYQEWKNSIYPSKNIQCQTCHMPVLEEGVVISNKPTTATARSPFARHDFTGANIYMLNLLKKYSNDLGVTATTAHLDSTIARTLRFLQKQSAELQADYQWVTDDTLEIRIAVRNKTGHKFPTGYPSRRAWIDLRLQNTQGTIIFESGAWDPTTNDISGLDEDFEPHYAIIKSSDQVQIYQSVMEDVDGKVTYTLLRAARYIKDNRIPPKGFIKNGVAYDSTEIIGLANNDPDFNANGSGVDTVIYRIGNVNKKDTYQLYVYLKYQSLSPRFVADLLQYDTPEVNQFKTYYEQTPNVPVTIDSLEKGIYPTGIGSQNQISPHTVLLIGAYPNPFNPRVTITLETAEPGQLIINIFNIAGQKVKTLSNKTVNKEKIKIYWDGTSDTGKSLASGEYLLHVRFKALGKASVISKIKKIVFIK